MTTKSIPKPIRDLIIEKIQDKVKPSIISKQLKISLASVYGIKKNPDIKNRGVAPKNNSKKMKFQLHQAVKRLTKSSERVTAKKIQEILPENIGLRTLQRRLKEDQCIKFRNIPKTIKLNKDQQNKRVEIIKGWFKQRLNFQNVIFTDEAWFSVHGPDRFMSWQLKDKIGDFNRMKRPFDGGGLMVHGVLGTDGSLMVTRVNGTVDSCKYIALLEHTILPYIVNKFGNKIMHHRMSANSLQLFLKTKYKL